MSGTVSVPPPPTIDQCSMYAEEYKAHAKAANISERRAHVLLNISRSWAALSNQLAVLSLIVKEEGN
jgi:hypothetical protein